MEFYFLLTNKLLDKNISKRNESIPLKQLSRISYLSKHQILSEWVAIGLHWPQEYKRVFPILLVSYSKSDDTFPEQFSFTDSFETQVLYMYDCSFVKSEKYSST